MTFVKYAFIDKVPALRHPNVREILVPLQSRSSHQMLLISGGERNYSFPVNYPKPTKPEDVSDISKRGNHHSSRSGGWLHHSIQCVMHMKVATGCSKFAAFTWSANTSRWKVHLSSVIVSSCIWIPDFLWWKKPKRLIKKKKKFRLWENRGCLGLSRKKFKIHLYFQMHLSLTYHSNTL